jgi:hypothetical protein
MKRTNIRTSVQVVSIQEQITTASEPEAGLRFHTSTTYAVTRTGIICS